MIAFIEEHRVVFGVGPICRVPGIAPSTFHAHKAVERDPELASDRAQRDILDRAALERVHDASRGRYGARKVWHALRREGCDIARCTVERLMRALQIQGVVARQESDHHQPRRGPAVPGRQGEPGLRGRHARPDPCFGLHLGLKLSGNCLRGSRHRCLCSQDRRLACFNLDGDLSIRYTERLAEAGVDTSVGSVGDSCDNALAESILGLFKTEVINVLGPWKSVGQVEWETLKWVDRYNTERLHSAIGYVTPQKA
jgi:transposase InsO family protein